MGAEEEEVEFFHRQHQTLPCWPEHPFKGQCDPKHWPSTVSAVPYDWYFWLLIPTFWWSRFVIYINAKAEMANIDQKRRINNWKATCGAELQGSRSAFTSSSLLFPPGVQNFESSCHWFSSRKMWARGMYFTKNIDPDWFCSITKFKNESCSCM